MNGIEFHKYAPEGTPLVPVNYKFIKPVQMRVRYPGGLEQLKVYETGEVLQVLEPEVSSLVTLIGRLKSIPLANGSTIIEFPEDIPVQILGS